MIPRKEGMAVRLGECVGYASGYLLFTTALFFALVFTGRVPHSWNYIHIMEVSAAISVSGVVLRRFLG